MKNPKLLIGSAPFLALLTFVLLGSASASAATLSNDFRPASLEIRQASSESHSISADRKRKKKKKKRPHCDAY